MNKIKCIVVDDEPVAIRILEKHLSVFSEIEIMARFNLATDALNYMRENHVDLLFLDIKMPRMTGIEFLKSCQIQPAVILTTAYRNYAVEAYDLDVIDYLVKPISLERIGRAISRYHERHTLHKQNDNHTSADQFIHIKSNKETVRLKVSTIQYIESMADYIIIYHDGGKIISRNRISQMEEELNNNLIRIHRRYLVPPSRIESITGNMIKINSKQLPIGRTYRHEVNKLLHLK